MYSPRRALKQLDTIEASITNVTIAATTHTFSDVIHPKAEYIAGLKHAILAISNKILMTIQEMRILISVGEYVDAKRLLREVRGMSQAILEVDRRLIMTRNEL